MEEITEDSKRADIVVCGAGPAGLSAAKLAAYQGRSVIVLEAGNTCDERDYQNPRDLVTGVGGAGLYSDGKLSFYPSASKLWQLADQEALEAAYIWVSNIFSDDIDLPPFAGLGQKARLLRGKRIQQKKYLSLNTSFDARQRIIHRLSDHLKNHLITGSKVKLISVESGDIQVEFEKDGQVHTVISKVAILAGGRFGSRKLQDLLPDVPMVFRRYELGVRLEGPADSFFLKDNPSLDPKYIISKPELENTEWRTFCTCRNGEIIETDFFGLKTLSGRSDHKRTEVSSVGFNIRFKSPNISHKLRAKIDEVLAGRYEPFIINFRDFMEGNAHAYGDPLDSLLRKGLRTLIQGREFSALTLRGPCLEGTGFYPDIDRDLKITGIPIWVAGDQSGIFRGLMAAFISGHYAAQKSHEYLTVEGNRATSKGVELG